MNQVKSVNIFLNVFAPFFSYYYARLGVGAMTSEKPFYTTSVINQWNFVEVRNINLNEDVPEEVIKLIKSDIYKYRIMIFKNQGNVSGKRQVEISRWFGDLDSTFYRHPASPNLDVFRVSNEEEEGCKGVGRTGWHIDGSFQPSPFAFSLYHIVNVPRASGTGKTTNVFDETSWDMLKINVIAYLSVQTHPAINI